MGKPIISVDFDGVLHSYSSGWLGAHVIPDPPVPWAINTLFEYLHSGFAVAIFSSRSSSIRGRWAMKKWLASAIGDHWECGDGSELFYLNYSVECRSDAEGLYKQFSWPWFKPPALVTIDDRALTFSGNWADYGPARIKAFKPWNKK